MANRLLWPFWPGPEVATLSGVHCSWNSSLLWTFCRIQRCTVIIEEMSVFDLLT